MALGLERGLYSGLRLLVSLDPLVQVPASSDQQEDQLQHLRHRDQTETHEQPDLATDVSCCKGEQD